jgi:hypothetical protein
MPDMTPVANQINPPDPQKGINTFSGILGIQQQRQALQTGQYQQQTAAATASQAGQRDKELKAAQAISLNGAKSGAYTNPDGTLNRQKMADDITGVAPTYGGEVSTQLLSQANEIVANQNAHQNLTLSRKKEIGEAFGSLAADPALDNTKFIDTVEKLRQEHKDDPEFSRMLTSMTTHYPGTADSATQRQIVGRWSAAATGESQNVPSQIDTGGQVQPGAQNRFTGAFNPAGAPVQKTLAPAQQPSYLGRAAAASNTAAGNAGGDVERNTQISASVQPSRAGIALADQISNLSEQVHTGKYSKAVADYAATIGQKDESIAARQLLNKYAAQLKTLGIQNAASDNQRGVIEAGLPDPDSMNESAIKQASEYIKGSLKMNLARAANARKFQSATGSTQGLRQADDQLTSNADPLMYSFRSTKPGSDERKDFIRRHFASPEQFNEFKGRMQAVEHYGGFNE